MIVCACGRQMRPVKIDVAFVSRLDDTHLYQIHAGDLFGCPKCGTKVINCNPNPTFQHFQAGEFERELIYHRERGTLFEEPRKEG